MQIPHSVYRNKVGAVVVGGCIAVAIMGWHGLVLAEVVGVGGVGGVAHRAKVVRAVLLRRVQVILVILGVRTFLGMGPTVLAERLTEVIIAGRDKGGVFVNDEKCTLGVRVVQGREARDKETTFLPSRERKLVGGTVHNGGA